MNLPTVVYVEEITHGRHMVVTTTVLTLNHRGVTLINLYCPGSFYNLAKNGGVLD